MVSFDLVDTCGFEYLLDVGWFCLKEDFNGWFFEELVVLGGGGYQVV